MYPQTVTINDTYPLSGVSVLVKIETPLRYHDAISSIDRYTGARMMFVGKLGIDKSLTGWMLKSIPQSWFKGKIQIC